MITVHAADAQPQFQAVFRPDDGPPTSAIVLWDDPTVAIVGSVSEIRDLLFRAFRALPIFITGPDSGGAP